MSRHRIVKRINIADEMDLDTGELSSSSSNSVPTRTADEEKQLEMAAVKVRSVLGSQEESGITDEEISDAAWELWFDVEKTVAWLLDEQDKKKERMRKAALPKFNTPKKTKQQQQQSPSASTPKSTPNTPLMKKKKLIPSQPSTAVPSRASTPVPSQLDSDLRSLNLTAPVTSSSLAIEGDEYDDIMGGPDVEPEPPKPTLAKEKLLEAVARKLEGEKKGLNLVIIGHVDAGKSTLMGRMLYELGELGEKARRDNERGSERAGKASFKWAWALDASAEERERGVTMDVAVTHIPTPSLLITLLDAPGHADFVPNMISGATQADAALLVVDAAPGAFEAGFDRAGQTREHLVLVRALGVSQVVVAVNKIDLAADPEGRYQEICAALGSFMVQSGFPAGKTASIPVSGMQGINLIEKDPSLGWFSGPTLLSALDALVPPSRLYTRSLRFPISNVFKGQTAISSGVGVSGRIVTGVIQMGDRLRILPGDESAVVRTIEQDDETVPWAVAGSSVTLYLANIDPIHLNIGSVLCPPNDLVPLASAFTAQIIIFDIAVPIIIGASVELFHQSRDVPVTITKLLATLDRNTGVVLKSNPRALQKSSSAKVQITIRSSTMSGSSGRTTVIPLETFSANKDMGRILLRRGGETIAAGIVTEIFS